MGVLQTCYFGDTSFRFIIYKMKGGKVTMKIFISK